ncbi:MAG TPA: MFS transporter [Bacillota bacterium]|nr:MFS transporter [Bacillota bacterium]
MEELSTGTRNTSQLPPSRVPFHYAWLVAAVTFLTLLISAGIRSTPGVLIVPLEQYFHWDRTVITFALAINLALYGFCGPFAAALIEKYGARRIILAALALLAAAAALSTRMQAPWQLILTWGIMVGVGTGFTSSVLGAVVANKWFKERKGLVVGILTASGAAGQLVFLPLLARAATSGGWQSAVWLSAAATLVVTVMVFIFMKNKPSDVGLLPYGALRDEAGPAESKPLKAVMAGLRRGIKSREFWLLSGSFFVCGASTNGLIGTHFIPAAIDKGISEVTAASLLALTGGFNIIGTTLSGWLSDRYNNRWLLFWYYGLRGLSLLFLPHAFGAGYLSLGLFIVFYGLDWIATVPPTVRLTTEVFGEQGGVVYGWIFAIHQLGAAAAAFGGGALHTWMGDYRAVFIISGVLCLLASGLVLRIGHSVKYAVAE